MWAKVSFRNPIKSKPEALADLLQPLAEPHSFRKIKFHGFSVCSAGMARKRHDALGLDRKPAAAM
jgi:hypothetical protein